MRKASLRHFVPPMLEDMNHAMKSAPLPTLRAVSFFHSTPFMERKRKNYWNSRFNYYARTTRKSVSKRAQLRNISDYAEYLFESWKDDDERSSSSSNNGTSWFRRQYCSKGTTKSGFGSCETQWGSDRSKRKGPFEFRPSDDDEVETIFRAAFGAERFYYWSFDRSNDSDSEHANNKSSSSWGYQTDDETDASPQIDLASERRTLGLRASGPLKLEEVKSAYRACALRWHPDRHHGSSKVAAEEKFKHCSAAYKSLCDRLVLNSTLY